MSRFQPPYTTIVLPLLLVFALSGCGVSSWVTAPDSKYPISMSSGLRDQNGELVASTNKTTVGSFEKHYKACSMLWRLISFTGDKDISDSVNEQVAANKGDAIQDLSVESSGTVWNIMTIIGIFPDCSNVRLKGTIVKVTPPAPPSAPAPAAAPAPSTPAVAPPPAPEGSDPAASSRRCSSKTCSIAAISGAAPSDSASCMARRAASCFRRALLFRFH